MKTKRILCAILAGLLLLSLVGCGTTAPATDSAAAGTAAAPAAADYSNQEYVYLATVSTVPYWVDGQAGIQAAADYLGVKCTFLGPTDNDVTKQIQQLDELVAKGVAGIIVYGADSAIAESINRAIAAGIPVICDNSDVASDRLMFTGFDGHSMGETGGAVMADLLGGKGKVIIGGFPSESVLAREQGYIDYFAENTDIEVLDVINDQADPSKAPEVYAQALAAHPDVNGIIGTDGDSGKGIAQALENAGLAGKIKVVCMDRNEDMLPYIENGTIDASVCDKAYMCAFFGVNMLFWYNNDIVNPIQGWKEKGINPMFNSVDSGVMVVTKDNVSDFYHNS
ncbi:MAG: substrate-binding domain-containing protein [Oscillospiraceae bacterium]|nr:substrate-binding domain-containing protein [Oscillospiraceae bacterium]